MALRMKDLGVEPREVGANFWYESRVGKGQRMRSTRSDLKNAEETRWEGQIFSIIIPSGNRGLQRLGVALDRLRSSDPLYFGMTATFVKSAVRVAELILTRGSAEALKFGPNSSGHLKLSMIGDGIEAMY